MRSIELNGEFLLLYAIHFLLLLALGYYRLIFYCVYNDVGAEKYCSRTSICSYNIIYKRVGTESTAQLSDGDYRFLFTFIFYQIIILKVYLVFLFFTIHRITSFFFSFRFISFFLSVYKKIVLLLILIR
jgi:hypothetical protein